MASAFGRRGSRPIPRRVFVDRNLLASGRVQPNHLLLGFCRCALLNGSSSISALTSRGECHAVEHVRIFLLGIFVLLSENSIKALKMIAFFARAWLSNERHGRCI